MPPNRTTPVPKKTTPRELTARVRQGLVELRLHEMARQLDEELDQGPPKDDTRLDLLWRLIEPQLNARRARAVQYRIKAARLPAPRSLDNFDFGFQTGLDRERILELATLDFVRRGQNLLLAGMSGTGKSHICIALGYLACAAGIRIRYTTSAAMLSKLQASLATNTLNTAIKPFVAPQLLIIDEVGLDRPERDGTPDAQLMYRVIRPRHEATRSTVITSNIAWQKWGDYLGDDIASVAILDRLIQHGHLITIEGPSYRAAEHSRLNAQHAAPKGRRGTKPRSKPRS